MEGSGNNLFDNLSNLVMMRRRRRRSQSSRRPRLDSQQLLVSDFHSASSLFPSTSHSEHLHSHENNSREFSLKQRVLRISSSSSSSSSGGADEGDNDAYINNLKGANGFTTSYNGEPRRGGSTNRRYSEGVLALPHWKSTNLQNGDSQVSGNPAVTSDGLGNKSKVKKVKLKLGNVTRTIRASATCDGVSGTDTSIKGSLSSESSRSQKRKNLQGNRAFDDDHSPSDKRSNISGVARKDSRKRDSSFGKEDYLVERMAGKEISKSEAVRKSRRIPKRRVMDDELGEDDEDDEIRYLEKLKTAKITSGRRDYEGQSGVKRKFSKISFMEKTSATSFGKDGKSARSDGAFEDKDYEEDEEPISDGGTELKKKHRKESVEPLVDTKREMTLTTRQRALQSSKDGSSDRGAGFIEFPNGLPPAPPRKPKEKLSDVEQQLKRAEAAQRRRMQVEKAARESEAEAIKKILGQDSARKKQEQKKKREEELAQEKAANELLAQLNCIRMVMGPNGTTVTFPKNTGFPAIFDSKPCSYPPPREKCAGPSCTNAYKYRDSKTRLPLCSLQCYKAIHENMKDGTKNIF